MVAPTRDLVGHAIGAGLQRGWTARVTVEGTAIHVRPTKHLATLVSDAMSADRTEVIFYDGYRTIGSFDFLPRRNGLDAIRDYTRIPALSAIYDELRDLAD